MYIYILSAAEGAGEGEGTRRECGPFPRSRFPGERSESVCSTAGGGRRGRGSFRGPTPAAAEQPHANRTQTGSSQARSTKLQIRPISPPSKVRPGLAYSCGWRARFFPNQPLLPWIPPVPGLFPRSSRNCCPLSPTATSVLRNVRFPAPAAKRCSQSLCLKAAVPPRLWRILVGPAGAGLSRSPGSKRSTTPRAPEPSVRPGYPGRRWSLGRWGAKSTSSSHSPKVR